MAGRHNSSPKHHNSASAEQLILFPLLNYLDNNLRCPPAPPPFFFAFFAVAILSAICFAIDDLAIEGGGRGGEGFFCRHRCTLSLSWKMMNRWAILHNQATAIVHCAQGRKKLQQLQNSMDNNNTDPNGNGGGANGGRKPTSSRAAGRKRAHENSGGTGNNLVENDLSSGGGRPAPRARQQSQPQSTAPQHNAMLMDLDLLLTPAADDDIVQHQNPQTTIGNGHQALNSQLGGALAGAGAAQMNDIGTSSMAPPNPFISQISGGASAFNGTVQNIDNSTFSRTQHNAFNSGTVSVPTFGGGSVVSNSDGGSFSVAQFNGNNTNGNQADGVDRGVPVWSANNHGAIGGMSLVGTGMARTGGLPLSLRGTVGVGQGGLEALPPRLREAVAQVNARQMQRMVSTQPEYAAIVPAIGANGFSNIYWVLLDWLPDMIMPRILGLVVLAGPFTTQTDINGYDVRLIFDRNNLDNEIAMHGWQECVARMGNISPGQIVEFTRLKVREQGRNAKGSFPFTLLYNCESRHRIVGQAPATVANAVCFPSLHTPIIVEESDQQNNGGRTTNQISNQNMSNQCNDVPPSEQPDFPLQQNVTEGSGDWQRQLDQHNNHDDNDDEYEHVGQSARVDAGTTAVSSTFLAAASNHDVVRNEASGSSTAWLSALRPPPCTSATATARPSSPTGRSSPPPPRASSISAQRTMAAIVERINFLEEEEARDERHLRNLRRRRRPRVRGQSQHESQRTPRLPRRLDTHSQRQNHVITIDSDTEPPVGVQQQQSLERGDAHFYDDELLTIEDQIEQGLVDGVVNEVVMMGNHPLSADDREWLLMTAFHLHSLPSSVKGAEERDELGRRNLSCCICHEWLVACGSMVVRPKCDHFLHSKCFESEAKQRRVCPMCSAHFITGKPMDR